MCESFRRRLEADSPLSALKPSIPPAEPGFVLPVLSFRNFAALMMLMQDGEEANSESDSSAGTTGMLSLPESLLGIRWRRQPPRRGLRNTGRRYERLESGAVP
jgi:hypothetical protein